MWSTRSLPRPVSLPPSAPGAAASPPRASPARALAGAGLGGYAIAVVLMLATTASILAGGWAGATGSALLVGVVAVLEAALMGRLGATRLAALLLVLPLCAAIVVPTTIGRLPPSVSHLGWYHVVGEYALQAVGGLLAGGAPRFFDWAFAVGLASAIWACGYWLGWVAFRERRGVLAVLPVMVVLAVNALNAPSLRPDSGPGSSVGIADTLAVLAALILIGLAELAQLAAAWRRRRIPAMAGLSSRFTTALVVASGLILVASLLLPPLTTSSIANIFQGLGGQSGRGVVQVSGGGIIGFSPAVAPGGPLLSRPQPVLTYYTDSGQDAYLAAVEDSVFNAGMWFPASTSALPDMTDQGEPAGTIPRDPAALGDSRSTETLHVTYAGRSGERATDGLGLFPGDPTSVGRSAVVLGQQTPAASATPFSSGAGPTPGGAGPTPGTPLATPGGCAPAPCSAPFLSVEEVSLSPPGGYGGFVSGGSTSVATVQQLEAAGTVYPSWVVSGYTGPLVQVPTSATAVREAGAIHALALRWTQGDTNPYDMAAAIAQHLTNPGAFSYTLTPPAAPAGTWPIVYFLQTSHAGYCQYFASAMGAMLRSLGIPSMLVSGFGPGTPTGRSTSTGQPIYSVSTTDAHVWVEVYFPGYGWVPFEPTPPSSYGSYLPFVRGGATPPPPTSPASAPASAAPRPTPRPLPASGPGSAGPGPSWWVLTASALGGVLALALVAGALSLLWWRRPGSLAGAWRRLGVAGRLAGEPRRAAETRAAFAVRLSAALGGSGPPRLSAELATMAAVTGKAEFSSAGLGPDDRTSWMGAWPAISRGVPRALRRRLVRRRRERRAGRSGS